MISFQTVLLFRLQLGISNHLSSVGVNTSCALSLRVWIFDTSEFSSSSMSATKVSPFLTPPHTMHILGIFEETLSHQTDGVLSGLSQK